MDLIQDLVTPVTCSMKHVHCYYVCIIIILDNLVAGLLARSQYPEGPATSHLRTDFLGFLVSVYK